MGAPNREKLADEIARTIDRFIEKHPNLMMSDALGALESNRHAITEAFLAQHTEVYTKGAIRFRRRSGERQ